MHRSASGNGRALENKTKDGHVGFWLGLWGKFIARKVGLMRRSKKEHKKKTSQNRRQTMTVVFKGE